MNPNDERTEALWQGAQAQARHANHEVLEARWQAVLTALDEKRQLDAARDAFAMIYAGQHTSKTAMVACARLHPVVVAMRDAGWLYAARRVPDLASVAGACVSLGIAIRAFVGQDTP